MNTLRVTPAYGRIYTSTEAARADWSAGKDFVVDDLSRAQDCGRYCSKRDFVGRLQVTLFQPAGAYGKKFVFEWEGA